MQNEKVMIKDTGKERGREGGSLGGHTATTFEGTLLGYGGGAIKNISLLTPRNKLLFFVIKYSIIATGFYQQMSINKENQT